MPLSGKDSLPRHHHPPYVPGCRRTGKVLLRMTCCSMVPTIPAGLQPTSPAINHPENGWMVCNSIVTERTQILNNFVVLFIDSFPSGGNPAHADRRASGRKKKAVPGIRRGLVSGSCQAGDGPWKAASRPQPADAKTSFRPDTRDRMPAFVTFQGRPGLYRSHLLSYPTWMDCRTLPGAAAPSHSLPSGRGPSHSFRFNARHTGSFTDSDRRGYRHFRRPVWDRDGWCRSSVPAGRRRAGCPPGCRTHAGAFPERGCPMSAARRRRAPS